MRDAAVTNVVTHIKLHALSLPTLGPQAYPTNSAARGHSGSKVACLADPVSELLDRQIPHLMHMDREHSQKKATRRRPTN